LVGSQWEKTNESVPLEAISIRRYELTHREETLVLTGRNWEYLQRDHHDAGASGAMGMTLPILDIALFGSAKN